MLIITSRCAEGTKTVDIHSARLPDGRAAYAVPQHELFRILATIGVQDIAATQGVQELVSHYCDYLGSPDPYTGKSPEKS
jgi:hypothetical protein